MLTVRGTTGRAAVTLVCNPLFLYIEGKSSNNHLRPMIPQTFVSPPSPLLFLCCVFTAATMMFFSTNTASAQVESSEEEERVSDAKNDEKSTPSGQIGVYFSLYGAIYEALPLDLNTFSQIIEVPDDDVMPYPSFFISFRYKNIGGIIGIEDDGDNERISILMLRYHQYVNKNMYAFGGPVLWRFNKEYNFTNTICTDYDYEAEPYIGYGDIIYPCKPGAAIEMDIETDRPDGRSLTFGVTTGLGVEYTLGGVFVFSHELEVFASPCQYRDFICFGGDLKFLGVHLKF